MATKPRPYVPDEDAPLLDLLLQGDEGSFESLVRKYQKRVYNIALLLGDDRQLAEEATRTTFVSAWREIRTLRSTRNFSSWLLSLLLRELRTQLDFREGSTGGGFAAGEVGDESGSSSREKLRNHLRQLPRELREVLVLHCGRGYPLDKVADILTVRVDTVLVRLQTAQDQVSRLLRQAGGVSGEGWPPFPHGEIRIMFPAYLENSTEPEEKERVRRHLAECGSCREALAELEWIGGLFRSMPDDAPPDRLLPAIMDACAGETGLPPRPAPSFTPFPRGRFALMALTVLAVTVFWYLVPGRENGESSKTVRQEQAPAPSPATGGGGAMQAAPAPAPSVRGGVLQVTERPAGRGEPSASPAVTVPLPPLAPVESARPVAQQPRQGSPVRLQPAAPLPTARGRGESSPELPADWGEAVPSPRSAPKKAAPARRAGGEMAVVLATDDQERAGREIETAVAAVGGTVTGRAHGGGRDILYTRVAVDSIMDLMGRLGGIGSLQELPHIPEGAEGRLDLVIRW